MQINEIEAINYVSKGNDLFDRIEKLWSENIKHGNKFLIIGKLGTFEIHQIIDYLSSSSVYFGVYDSLNKSYAYLCQCSYFQKSKSTIEEHIISVKPKYRGLNLPVRLYAWLIKKKNLTIISSDQHSPGGRNVWERLANTSGIFVYGYNMFRKKAFQIDPNDISSFEIYDIDLQEEIDDLQTELDELKLKNSSDEIKKKAQYLQNQIFKLTDAQDSSGSIRLIATKDSK